MIRTRVGYTGGTKDSPTYHRLGDHTEALQVDYNPVLISFTELLEAIFDRQDPFSNIGHTQYMNGLWYHNEDQAETLEAFFLERFERTPDHQSVETKIQPLDEFYRAEGYHQKYYLRKHDRYMDLFEDHSDRELTDSTLAARLNGILGGKATSLDPYNTLDEVTLPDQLENDLKSRVS